MYDSDFYDGWVTRPRPKRTTDWITPTSSRDKIWGDNTAEGGE